MLTTSGYLNYIWLSEQEAAQMCKVLSRLSAVVSYENYQQIVVLFVLLRQNNTTINNQMFTSQVMVISVLCMQPRA